MSTGSPERRTGPSKVTPSEDTQQDDTKDLEKSRREKKPFFYCRIVAKYPVKSFVITLLCHVAMLVISGILVASGFNLFPTNFEVLPMELYDIPYRLRDYAWRDKDNYNNKFKRTLTNDGLATYERGLYSSFSSVDLYYDTDGGNIFTKANLQRIQRIENDLNSSSSFSSICMTQSSSMSCKPIKSVLRYFDGTYKHINATFDDRYFNNIPAVLFEAFNNSETKEDFMFFLPNGYSLSDSNAHGSLTRSVMLVGCSINSTSKCSSDSWKSLALSNLQDGIETKLKDSVDSSTDDFKFYFFSSNLWLADVLKQAILDMMCAVGSMLFIFCFMLFHTRSFWIAGWAMISILLSFLGTNIIYTGVIDFQYFGFFHILSIFIILGIGADDVFVFYDNWRLTAFATYPSLAHRLSDTYSKSVTSMLITSLTTSVAFFSSAISPLLATRSFGVFSGLLVIYNYLSVIIFFPTVVTMYHLKYEQWTCPCCRKCTKKDDESLSEKGKAGISNEVFIISDVEMTVHEPALDTKSNGGSRVNVTVNGDSLPYIKEKSVASVGHSNGRIANGNAGHTNGIVVNGKPSTNEIKTLNSEKKPKEDSLVVKALHKKKQKRMVVFFRDHYLWFITHKITRCVALPLFVVLVGYFAYSASTLEPDNEQLQIYKKSHFYSQALDKELYSFVKNVEDNMVSIYIVWGISLKDRSDCHFSSIACRGKQVYDSSFDPNPEANQMALKRFCDFFFDNMTSSDYSLYRIKTDASGTPDVACFTRSLETYLGSLSISGLPDLSLPWDSTKTLAFMNAQTKFYDTSGFSTYTDFLSIPMQYWMYDGYLGNYTADYGLYNDLFGEEKTTFSKELKLQTNLTNTPIYYGNKLKYLAVRVNTTINRRTTGYSTGLPIVERWENFIQSQMSGMPTGLKNGFQLTWRSWHWFYVLQSLADNAVTGIVIGVSLAFPILSLSTMNVVIGFLASLSICCTTVCVIGVIPLAGWKLGLLTSLNMCLVVGLAVDYVVHLAEAYTLSLHKDRYNRTRDMLEEMGPSVFSGACTTLGASIFMFAAQVQFFMQFGVFMFCTIGFSLIFSLGLFTMLVGLIGPQNNIGNLKVLFQKCRSKCQKKAKKT